MEKCLQHLHHLYKGIHVGRADPDLLDCVKVPLEKDYFQLNQLCLVSTVSTSVIKVQPFDREWLKAVEKAINDAKLGVTTDRTPDTVLVKLPQLSGDRRQQLVKVAKDLAEKQKVAIRNLRRDARTSSPDQHKQIEKMTKQFIEAIDECFQQKQSDIAPKSIM